MTATPYLSEHHYEAPDDAEPITQGHRTIFPRKALLSVYSHTTYSHTTRVSRFVAVTGTRILKSGQPGRSEGRVWFSRDERDEGTDRHADAAPQWVRDLLDGTP